MPAENDNSIPKTIDELSHRVALVAIRARAEQAVAHRDRLHLSNDEARKVMAKGLLRGAFATFASEWSLDGAEDMMIELIRTFAGEERGRR